MTITLPPALDRIVRDKVNAGLYASESELVCEALRREFARDTVHEWVRAQAADGFAQLDTGESVDLTREELMGRLAQRRATGSCA
jgi:antitoxin ParD1/3/4